MPPFENDDDDFLVVVMVVMMVVTGDGGEIAHYFTEEHCSRSWLCASTWQGERVARMVVGTNATI